MVRRRIANPVTRVRIPHPFQSAGVAQLVERLFRKQEDYHEFEPRHRLNILSMKVISKYKDYYDYLVSVYGIDEHLVLDRRVITKRDQVIISDEPKLFREKISFYICGMLIEGYRVGEDMYFFEELRQFAKKQPEWYSRHRPSDIVTLEINTLLSHFPYDEFRTKMVKDIHEVNRKNDCPVLVSAHQRRPEEHTMPFPKLSDYGIPRVLPADDIFKMLTQWLSDRKSAAENVETKVTDEQKIQNKGFDKKRSFRPKMKT